MGLLYLINSIHRPVHTLSKDAYIAYPEKNTQYKVRGEVDSVKPTQYKVRGEVDVTVLRERRLWLSPAGVGGPDASRWTLQFRTRSSTFGHP